MVSKNVLVTGGTKGIGRAIAERFLAEGFSVMVCASSERSLKEALAEQPALKGLVCDVTLPTDVASLARHVESVFGTLDVLVNNAGKYVPGTLLGEEEGALEHMLNINLIGAYRVTRAVAPAMVKRRAGSIFNICSTASIMAYANGGSYSIAKHALLGFSRTLREELKSDGVRVVSVIPGATMTSSWDGVAVVPDRLMPPEDVASAVWAAHALSPRTVVEEIVLRPMMGDLP